MPRGAMRLPPSALALLAAVALLPGTPPATAQGAPAGGVRSSPSGAPTEALAREILRELVAFNTTASTGATTPAAEALAARFRRAGFPAADVIVAGPNARNRNVVLRWRGRTRGKPIVFAAHLDVVEAPRLEWSTDPFRLTERGGALYGRGVLDDKGPIAAIAAAIIRARARGLAPERDLVFAFTAGEETGVDDGVEWLLRTRRPLVDGEFALILDSGGGDVQQGRIQAYAMQAAEKVYLDLEMVARGPGGHSSTPPDETPVERLARAILRVDAHRFPVRVNPVVREFFRQRALLMPPGGERDAMGALAREPDDLAAQGVLLRNTGVRHLLRTTCVTTMLRGGTAPNAIPQEAVATVNCRLLPGESQEGTIAALRAAVGDSAVAFRVAYPALASEASVASPAFLATLRRVVDAIAPGVPIIPYMEGGGTDGIFFRNAGIPAFGVNGFFLDDETIDRMHGRDERIPLPAFRTLVRYSERLLAEFAAMSPTTGPAR